MNCIDGLFCEGRVRLALLSLVSVMTLAIGNADALTVSNADPRMKYRDLLICDLVVRGTVVSITERDERWADAMPMVWTSDPDAMIRVKEIHLDIAEVLKGVADADTTAFIGYATSSSFRDNYVIGQETVLGLMWGPHVLGGMFWMYSDGGRFIRTPTGWALQAVAVGEFEDIEDIRLALAEVSPRRVLLSAGEAGDRVVLVGTLAGQSLVYASSPDGSEYVVRKLKFADVRTLSGSALPTRIEAAAIVSGDYWPDWRLDPACPRWMKEGKRYCLVVRQTESGLVVPRPVNGAFEVRDDNRLYFGGRRAVGIGLEEVKLNAEESTDE